METRSIGEIISQISLGNLVLPEFQRGYVWGRGQVKELITSLYKGYPIGSLLFWSGKTDSTFIRNQKGEQNPTQCRDLILDGQQRITSLYGLKKGEPPAFFDGNDSAFIGLYFHIPDESFVFASAGQMKIDDYAWASVTEILNDPIKVIRRYISAVADNTEQDAGYERINRIHQILNIQIPIEMVAENSDVSDVVDIFNRINSGGTKLGQGDLALARICGEWPRGRSEIRHVLDRFDVMGYATFDIDWFLRCLTVNITGKSSYADLTNAPLFDIQHGVLTTENVICSLINQIGTRLGLDSGEMLGSKYSFPTMIYCVNELQNPTNRDWNKLMYWYVHSMLWGRYSSSVESRIAQDISIFSELGIDGMISHLLQQHHGGVATVSPVDFDTWSRGARFYRLLYILARTGHAKDWSNGLELSHALLGPHAALELHHVFPKAQLYKYGYPRNKVNHIANYVFLTQETNRAISDTPVAEYLPVYMKNQPDAVLSHWIPTNPQLFDVARYEDFLRERMVLLAKAANNLLDNLYHSERDTDIIQLTKSGFDRGVSVALDHDTTESDEINQWLKENQVTPGELDYSIVDENGLEIALFDMAWPEGIRVGLSQKIALILHGDSATIDVAGDRGFLVFTSVEKLRQHIKENYLS